MDGSQLLFDIGDQVRMQFRALFVFCIRIVDITLIELGEVEIPLMVFHGNFFPLVKQERLE